MYNTMVSLRYPVPGVDNQPENVCITIIYDPRSIQAQSLRGIPCPIIRSIETELSQLNVKVHY